MAISEMSVEDALFAPKLGASSMRLFVSHQNSTIQDLRISFHSKAMDWVRIQKDALFNYSPDICGPVFGGGFNPTREYIITVGLKPEQVTVLSILFEGGNLLEWLFSPSNTVDLSNPDNYLLYSVMQQVTPKTQWGMTTTFHPVGA
jgi:hypothetical protein